MSAAYVKFDLAQDMTVQGLETVTQVYDIREPTELQETIVPESFEEARFTTLVVGYKMEVRDVKENGLAARMVVAASQLTDTWDVDPHLIAAVLARVDSVQAIHVTGADRKEMHIWVVVSDLSNETLSNVFDKELDLHEHLGQRLAAVEFHVTDSADGLRAADRIFERDR